MTGLRRFAGTVVLGVLLCTGAAAADDTVLNVVVTPFEAGVPSNPADFRDLEVFPRIRNVETRLLPFQLAEHLVNSAQWGAVRVIAEPDEAADVQVYGSIVQSDGWQLTLDIRVVDSTGAEWFDRRFSTEPDLDGDEVTTSAIATEFDAIFEQISKAMLYARRELDDTTLRRISGTSLMRYASNLAPDAFEGYVEQGEDGRWTLLRLPAYNDPMLRRIELVRNTEFLITDSVDTSFRETSEELAKAYRVWREYRRKFMEYEKENERFAAANTDDAPKGSWEAIKDQYDIYRYDRITVQERDRLALAFSNEVTPTIEAMEERIDELNAWVSMSYREWRDILQQLDEVDRELGE